MVLMSMYHVRGVTLAGLSVTQTALYLKCMRRFTVIVSMLMDREASCLAEVHVEASFLRQASLLMLLQHVLKKGWIISLTSAGITVALLALLQGIGPKAQRDVCPCAGILLSVSPPFTRRHPLQQPTPPLARRHPRRLLLQVRRLETWQPVRRAQLPRHPQFRFLARWFRSSSA